MAKQPKIGATVTLDGEKEFKAALSEINAGLKVNASQMQLVAATYQDGGKSVRDLVAAQGVLEDQIASQTDKVRVLEQVLQSSAQKNGESSKKNMEWQASLNKAKVELIRMEAALKKNQDTLEKASSATGNFSEELEKTEGAGEKAKSGTDIFNISLGNLIADGIKKTISAIGDLLEKTAEYRSDMSKLEQNTRDAGASMEVVQDGMRRLNAITGETDSNIEAVSNLLAAGFTDNNLVTAIDTLSGAVIKFPDTIKIESLSDSLQETLATKEATGQFAEALERLGINVDGYNKRIAKMSDSQARNYTISILQKKGLEQVKREWRANNEGIVNSADVQYKLNEKMAEFAEKIEPIVTKAMDELNRFIDEHEEEITNFIDAWVMIAETVIPVVVDGFDALTTAIFPVLDVLNKVIEAGKKLKELAPKTGDFISKAAGSFNLLNSTDKIASSYELPRYARGTSYHPGGLATINDGNGYSGETILLPRGSRVYPASQGSGGDTYYNISIA